MVTDASIDKLDDVVKKYEINKQLIRNCVPLEVDKLEMMSEVAFSRLLSVNNNIVPTDYGQGIYDDKATIKR
jgi:hypothetical protein